jgi:hypothetical protein
MLKQIATTPPESRNVQLPVETNNVFEPPRDSNIMAQDVPKLDRHCPELHARLPRLIKTAETPTYALKHIQIQKALVSRQHNPPLGQDGPNIGQHDPKMESTNNQARPIWKLTAETPPKSQNKAFPTSVSHQRALT